MTSSDSNLLFHRSLAAKFHEAVAGTFSPGFPIGLVIADEGSLRWVYQHECAHSVLTHGSTLGAAAILCGIVDLYSDDAQRRQSVRKYLTKYTQKCCRAHEGTATAIAISMTPTFQRLGLPYARIQDLEKSLPRTYTLISNQIFDYVVQVAELAKLDDPNDTSFLVTSLAIAFGLAVMSPPVDDELFKSALRGENMTPKPLKSAGPRLKHCLVKYPVEALAADAIKWSKEESRHTVSGKIQAKFRFAQTMSEVLDIEFFEMKSIAPYFRKYLPELAEHADFIKPASLSADHQKVFFDIQHSSLFRPRRVKYLLDDNPLQFLSSTKRRGQLCLAEAGWTKAGRVLVLHAFQSDGSHVTAHVSPTNLFDQCLLEFIKQFPTKPDDRIGVGIVVSIEALHENPPLRQSLESHDVLPVALHQGAFSKLKSRELLWGEGGVGVYLSQRIDSVHLYDVAPLGFRQAAPPSAPQRACAWILQNGLIASIRWNSHRIEESENV